MSFKSIVLGGVAAIMLSGCASADAGNKQTLGGLLGAAGGAVAGAQFGKGKGQLVGVAAGTLLGAVLGSEVGKSLDRADQLYMTRTTQRALESAPSHQTSSWANPDTGHAGTVTPSPAYRNGSGQYCREFQQTVTIGGREERAYGTACRQPDGSWQVVDGAQAASVESGPAPVAEWAPPPERPRPPERRPYGRW